jgi:hypothetical protein
MMVSMVKFNKFWQFTSFGSTRMDLSSGSAWEMIFSAGADDSVSVILGCSAVSP